VGTKPDQFQLQIMTRKNLAELRMKVLEWRTKGFCRSDAHLFSGAQWPKPHAHFERAHGRQGGISRVIFL
jgi:hypothetical protein